MDTEDIDETNLHETLGREWQIEVASIKPYATCRSTHSAMDAVLDVRARGTISAETVTGLTVHTSALIADMCGNPTPVLSSRSS
ncbi:MmgE/PrpD family protein [Arthrobacter sp. StoSoilB5]|uniref:MmgE/PrpD family protein n=1 Tax=Arthrobacter sp. StoSoilB5 TaxID=2830992 RepID=UPI001CC5541E|nr:MmgE/PrpD family protein [Arthrobacter sp. StoSoilB5]BCW44838.1 hypothetical protein StoSoilB5_20220 [Arthrobacter sp. StoSoilB5]